MKAPTFKKPPPFIDTGELQITAYVDNDKQITSFIASYKGESEKFEVKKFNVLATWRQLEKWFEERNKQTYGKRK